MELLERYLQAVKKHLPAKRQADILAELRANMESQLEDKEAELGRPLTQGETEDWLRAMGSPLLVASRYRPQQYLIGPALYPIYLYVLRVVMVMATLVYTVVSAIVIAVNSPEDLSAIAAAVGRVPGIWVSSAAWVTIVFAALEFVVAHFPEKVPSIADLSGPWSPSALPPLERDDKEFGKPRSYAHAVAEVVFGFVFLVWLLLIPEHPFLLLGPGVVFLHNGPFELAPVWWAFFWCCVALNVVQLTWRSILLFRGIWQRRSIGEYLVSKLFGLISIGIVLTAKGGVAVLLRNPDVNRPHYGAALDSINRNIHLGFLVVGIIVALQLAWDMGRFLHRGYQERAASH